MQNYKTVFDNRSEQMHAGRREGAEAEVAIDGGFRRRLFRISIKPLPRRPRELSASKIFSAGNLH